MGRPQKPIELKIKDGTFRKGSHPDPSTIMRIEGTVETPSHFDEPALKLWETVVKPMIDAGIIQKTDEPMAVAMCDCYSLYSKARESVTENPCDKEKRCAFTNYFAAFERIASKFGMNPVDRARVVGHSNQAAEFAELDRLYG